MAQWRSLTTRLLSSTTGTTSKQAGANIILTTVSSSGPLSNVAHLVLSREARRNALSRSMVDDLRNTFAELRKRPPTALLISSSRPEVFCAGADLKERAGLSAAEAKLLLQDLRTSFNELAELPCPTVACVDGFALGGGAELAIACDLRVASDSATFGFPETGLAIIPGAGGTQRLPRLVGVSRAKELIFTGRRVGTDEAEKIGLVDIVAGRCDNGKPQSAYMAAVHLSEKMASCGPLALQLAKTAIDKGAETDLDTGMALEAACYFQTMDTKDRKEGIAAFNEKRAPVYVGE